MSTKGNFANSTPKQVFDLIARNKMTGKLCLFEGDKSDEARDQFGELAFQNGHLVYASLKNRPYSLVSVLREDRLLPDEQAKRIEEGMVQHNTSEKAVAHYLIEKGHFTKAQIVTAIQTHIVACLNDVMNWQTGNFELLEDVSPPDEVILAPVSLIKMVFRSYRKDEK